MKKIWTADERKQLELLLKEGCNIKYTSELMGISPSIIRRELQDKLTEEEYKQRRYLKYSAEKAIAIEVKRITGGM